MPVYSATTNNMGGLASNNDASDIIKEGFRKIDFKKNAYPEGVTVLFAPPYKPDGTWFKVLDVRTGFQVNNFSQRYVTIPNDPVNYFTRNVNIKYQDYVKSFENAPQQGKFKARAPWGYISARVIFNTFFYDDLAKGVHLLELPQANGASQLDTWMRAKDIKTKQVRGPVCNADNSVPVYLRLLTDGGKNPWVVTPDASGICELPPELSDAEYLYNLDEVYVQREAEDIFTKLKDMVDPEIFADCMKGYRLPGETEHMPVGEIPKKKVAPAAAAAEAPVEEEAPKLKPKLKMPTNMAKASVGPAKAVAAKAVPEKAGTAGKKAPEDMSAEELAVFLNQPAEE